MADDGMFGFKVRPDLFPGEQTYFQANPHVGGMMVPDTQDVILNLYSPPTVNRDAVARNEAFRLHLRQRNAIPPYAITDQQRQSFQGTEYAGDDNALRETLAARIYSGDPSAQATPEQQQWVKQFLQPAAPEPIRPATRLQDVGTE